MNTYLVTIVNRDEIHEVCICKTDNDFISLLNGLDKDNFRIVSIDIINVPVTDDIFGFIKRDPNLNVGQ